MRWAEAWRGSIRFRQEGKKEEHGRDGLSEARKYHCSPSRPVSQPLPEKFNAFMEVVIHAATHTLQLFLDVKITGKSLSVEVSMLLEIEERCVSEVCHSINKA